MKLLPAKMGNPSLKTIWIHVLIPLVVLTLYFVSLSWFLSWLLPEYGTSVNAVFVSSSWKFSLLLAAGLYMIFFIFIKIKRGNRFTYGNSIERLCLSDFFLILLPLAPIIQYILSNQDILSPLGSLYIVAVFAIFSVLFIIVTPTLLGTVASTKTLMILGLAFTFMITVMASLSADFNWFGEGNLMIQLVIFGAIFLVSWILYNVIGRKSLYLVVAIIFITNSAIQFMPDNGENITPSSTDNKLVELIGSETPPSTPNIYLLLYDAYVPNETMLGYGIDNSAQEKYLETMDFKLYPHTYSIGAVTTCSMSRVFEVSEEYLSTNCWFDAAWKGPISGNGIVQKLLRSFGYKTYGIFSNDYLFQGVGSSYDFSFPELSSSYSSANLLMKAIFMGEFRFDVGFETSSMEQFVEYKQSIFQSLVNSPRFVYVHTNLPGHSQFSGTCRPNETELYKERLIQANDQMKQDIETITQTDPGAIIVVAGDHGAYLTKNCNYLGDNYDISEISRLDIQDRHGTFLAIKWPDEDFSKYDNITVLQDIFPAVFAYLFEDDRLLEAKVVPTTLENGVVSGALVQNGIIYGGINDGEPLFASQTPNPTFSLYPVADTQVVAQNPTSNYGTQAQVVVQEYKSSDRGRALFQFDLSSIPAGSTINSATFSAHYYSHYLGNLNPVGRTYNLYRNTSPWTETEVNWNIQPSFTTTQGTSTVMPGSFGWVNWNVQDIVQTWVDGTTNYGFVMMDSNETEGVNSLAMFYSKEYAGTTPPPRLVIDYTLPALASPDQP